MENNSNLIEISTNDNKRLDILMEEKNKILLINKLINFSEGGAGRKDSVNDRKGSIDNDIKTENQNSLNVEIDDPEYMNFDPLDDLNGNNNFDFEIKEDLQEEKEQNDIYSNIVINEKI